MTRIAFAAALLAALVAPSLSGQSPEFEVASIKRGASDTSRPGGGPPSNPGAGQLALNQIPARFLATRAFTGLTTPFVVEGLPPWADSERWDVVVRFKPGATAEEQAGMWRRLLADRMKLMAHVETRSRPAYELVLARSDGRLGPQLKPSTLNCPPLDPSVPVQPDLAVRDVAMSINSQRRAPTPQEEAVLVSQCSGTISINNRTYAGAVDVQGLIQAITFMRGLDRPVVDATGLKGRYALKLWAAGPATVPLTAAPPGAPPFDDAPSLFGALQDQLGLKLEPATIDGRVLIVDHIERPTEN
jgi:uncharacterized protein (TIGR03435 family)